jgi:hypothetical protein
MITLAALLGLVIAAVLLIEASGADADDSEARLGAGGIGFTRNEHIRMVEEVLEISAKTIHVRFRFLNESDQDIHTTVAFPLPLYGPRTNPPDGPYLKPHPGFIMDSFSVLVNGRPVSKQLNHKAVIGGRDVAPLLFRLGLSDEQIYDTFNLTPDQEAALNKIDVGGKKLIDWEIAETAFWQQTFPAGKEIIVEHSYEPIVGSISPAPYQNGFVFGSDLRTDLDMNGEVCLDEITQRAILNRIKSFAAKGTGMVYVLVEDVEYILRTGRNWKGPIGRFILRIKKKTPNQFVSLCFPGKPQKVSPTVYEFRQKDFVPPDKLVVYFYTVEPD